jgi:hypothetical protein
MRYTARYGFTGKYKHKERILFYDFSVFTYPDDMSLKYTVSVSDKPYIENGKYVERVEIQPTQDEIEEFRLYQFTFDEPVDIPMSFLLYLVSKYTENPVREYFNPSSLLCKYLCYVLEQVCNRKKVV